MARSEDEIRREINDRVRGEVDGARQELLKQVRQGKLDHDGLQLQMGVIEARARSFWGRVLRRS